MYHATNPKRLAHAKRSNLNTLKRKKKRKREKGKDGKGKKKKEKGYIQGIFH